MKNKNIVLISIILIIVVFILGSVYYQKNEDVKASKVTINNLNDAPFIRNHSPKFGNITSSITIVEFLDPSCGACKSFHPILKKVFNEYKNDIKLVIRYLANHKSSKLAIRVLEASRSQDKFNEVLEIIFANQSKWSSHYGKAKEEVLWSALEKNSNIDIEKLKRDFNDNYIDGILNLDSNDAHSLKVRGTPTVFINGKELKKLDYNSLSLSIEEEVYK